MSYYDEPAPDPPAELRELTQAGQKFVRELAAADGAGYLVGAMHGREALVVKQAGEELWRGDSYNYATLRKLHRAGVVDFQPSVEITYRARRRGDTTSGDPVSLTALGRSLAGLPTLTLDDLSDEEGPTTR